RARFAIGWRRHLHGDACNFSHYPRAARMRQRERDHGEPHSVWLMSHCGLMPRSRCCWLSAKIAWLVSVLGSHPHSWLAQQLHSAAVSALIISEMSQPASPLHAVLTRSRSLHSSVHSVASQVKPACAPFACRQLWYSSQTLA